MTKQSKLTIKPKTTKKSIVVNGKKKVAKPLTKTQSLQAWSRRNMGLVVFLAIFGGIGVYFLVKSLAATPSAPYASFNITSWNSSYDNPTNVGSSILKFAPNSDIIGIQEVHKPSQRKNIKSKLLCSSCKYAGYVRDYTYDGSSPASLPILWDKSKFSYIEKGYVTMSPKVTGIKDATGSNVSVSAKYITWVRLRDKVTTRSFYVMNLHTVASVESGGKPITANAKRLEIYRKGMDVLLSKTKSFSTTDRPIVILGDFNVNYRYDSVVKNSMFPYARLNPIKVSSSFQVLNQILPDPTLSTHGTSGRLIDYVFALQHDRLTVDNEFIDAGTYGSDHHPVTNTVTIYNADPTTIPEPTPIPIGTPLGETSVTVSSDAVITE